jgi:hypothetical protein
MQLSTPQDEYMTKHGERGAKAEVITEAFHRKKSIVINGLEAIAIFIMLYPAGTIQLPRKLAPV